MRLAIGFLLLASPAHAEELVHPMLPVEVSAGYTLHAGKLAGVDESGMGPNLEVAVGSGRWQGFGETSLTFGDLGPMDDRVDGKAVRGGIGARWLARTFELTRRATIDMHLEAGVGYSRHYFDGMRRFSRPDIGAGVGYRLRAFFGSQLHKQLALHVSMRIYFAPTDRRDEQIACRGTCAITDGNTNGGTLFVIAGAF